MPQPTDHSVPSVASASARSADRNRTWLHRYAIFVSGWILALIFLGGQVKSTNSGLSVPDWPNTYHHFMFFFPWEKMVGGIFWEHTHRMVASVAGLLTFALTIWIYRTDARRWVRRLGLAASLAVLAQGVLGGLTVLLYLPTWASSGHGTLAQIYLCLVVTIALVTARSWRDTTAAEALAYARPGLRTLVLATTVVIFCQLVIGAIMRHSDAGLAIPDFPTMFGSWVPPLSQARLAAANRELIVMDLQPVTMWQMAAHLLHRLGALTVACMVLVTVARSLRASRTVRSLRWPSLLLLALLLTQVTLGILTILTGKQYTITTLHVVCGAATLATSLVLTIRTRHEIAPASAMRSIAGIGSGGGVPNERETASEVAA